MKTFWENSYSILPVQAPLREAERSAHITRQVRERVVCSGHCRLEQEHRGDDGQASWRPDEEVQLSYSTFSREPRCSCAIPYGQA